MANYVLNRTGQQISDILDGAYSANGILKSNGSGTITAQTVDSTPTSESTNLVTSGGVASALNGKADASALSGKADKSTAVSVTIAVADWSNNTCTKSVSGVTSSNNIIVAPDPTTSFFTYGDAQIRATAQGSGTVTFTCEAVPSESVTVIVLIVG